MRRFLHLFTVAAAMMFLSVAHGYPPRALGQSADELERHIEGTDRNVAQNQERIAANWSAVQSVRTTVETDHTDLAVLEGKIGLLETIGGAILLAVLGNLAISWKGKRA